MPRVGYRDRELRLGFCTNVFPADTPEQILQQLGEHIPPIRQAMGGGTYAPEFGLGLWIPSAVSRELDSDPGRASEFGVALAAAGVELFTLNGFPYGDFHAERIKEDVFRPRWDQPERLEYTLQLGRLLSLWMSMGDTGSISTLSGGYKAEASGGEFAERCARQLTELALAWDQIYQDTGRELVLGLEPEPDSTLETTDEIIDFFENALFSDAQHESVLRRHIGICYDACHQAVEYEDPAESLARLKNAGIRIAKLQITNALEVRQPGASDDRLRRLAQFAEPRYLHQVSRQSDGGVVVASDLETLLPDPPKEWRDADRWRIHFHVPVHQEEVSGFHTTRDDLVACIAQVLQHDLTRHLEVETYTWGVLPGEAREGEALSEGLAAEMMWTLEQLRKF